MPEYCERAFFLCRDNLCQFEYFGDSGVQCLELICGELLITRFLIFVFAVGCSRFEKGFGIVA